jgi:rSAM/selenodomain-associated transferase 1
VFVIAKAPAAGRAKTRLTPPLTAAQAAALQQALLLDTLEACRAEVPAVSLLHADPDEASELRRLAGPETELVLQEGRGLADALGRTLETHLPAGPVAIVSSDIPGVPRGSLARTFEALEQGADVVLGPALDGGYWLIAMRGYHPEPLREIPWSTPAVLAVTLRRCRDAGLRVELLETWRDLDTMVDLAFAARQADSLPARRTASLLRELELPDPPSLRLAGRSSTTGSRPTTGVEPITPIWPCRGRSSSSPSRMPTTCCSSGSTAIRCAIGRSRSQRGRCTTARRRSRLPSASWPRRRADAPARGGT